MTADHRGIGPWPLDGTGWDFDEANCKHKPDPGTAVTNRRYCRQPVLYTLAFILQPSPWHFLC